MTERILQILDNVRYWETCPEDYKRDIKTFLELQSTAVGKRQSEELVCLYCGINPMKDNCKHVKKCSTKDKVKAN